MDRIDIWCSEFVETFRMWFNDFPLGVRKQITNLLNDIETQRYKDPTKVKDALQGILALFDESKPLSEPLVSMQKKTIELLESLSKKPSAEPPMNAPLPTPAGQSEATPVPQEVLDKALKNWSLHLPETSVNPKPMPPK